MAIDNLKCNKAPGPAPELPLSVIKHLSFL